jgi:hypothetical protein
MTDTERDTQIGLMLVHLTDAKRLRAALIGELLVATLESGLRRELGDLRAIAIAGIAIPATVGLGMRKVDAGEGLGGGLALPASGLALASVSAESRNLRFLLKDAGVELHS